MICLWSASLSVQNRSLKAQGPMRALLLHDERGATTAVRDTAHNLGLHEPSGSGAATWAKLCDAQLPPSRVIHQDARPFGGSFLCCSAFLPGTHDWEFRRAGSVGSTF